MMKANEVCHGLVNGELKRIVGINHHNKLIIKAIKQ